MSGQPSLAERHDALLLDLDGTLVLAGRVIDHAADAVQQARNHGARVLVVTNNASRSPASVAERLAALGIPMDPADVVSSPEAASAMLAASHRPGEKVLVVGAEALRDAVAAVGLVPVTSAEDEPVAVVQGHSPDTGWRDLAEACVALRAGADWVATNTDSTLPSDRGLLPGNGAMVGVLVTATGRHPRVAGKPHRPLLDAAVRRVNARRPLLVGDRLDTDIAAALSAEMPSLFVLTGVSTAADLLAAPASRRPHMVAADLRGLIDPGAYAVLPTEAETSGAQSADQRDADRPWRVSVEAEHLELRAVGDSAGSALAALAVLAASAWQHGITDVRAGGAAAERALKSLGLA